MNLRARLVQYRCQRFAKFPSKKAIREKQHAPSLRTYFGFSQMVTGATRGVLAVDSSDYFSVN